MKPHLLLIVAISVLVLGLVSGCGGADKESSPERDEALKFYQQLYPLSTELRTTVDEWNSWQMSASQQDYEQNLHSKTTHYKTKLMELSYKLVALYAPPGLRGLKDLTVSAVNKGIESFGYGEDYAITYTESYRLKAESAQLEFNRLLGLAADEYDDGLTRYQIKPTELLR